MIKNLRTGLLAMAFGIVGCSKDYDGGRRFIAEIQVENSDGSPVTAVEVQVLGTVTGGGSEDDLGAEFTDDIGKVQLRFPPVKNGNYSLLFPETDLYPEQRLTGIENSDFINYTYTLNGYTRYKKAQTAISQIVPQRVSEATILSIWADGGIAPLEQDLHPTLPVSEDYIFQTRYTVLKNSVVTIHYLVEEAGVITQQNTDVEILNYGLTYTLSY